MLAFGFILLGIVILSSVIVLMRRWKSPADNYNYPAHTFLNSLFLVIGGFMALLIAGFGELVFPIIILGLALLSNIALIVLHWKKTRKISSLISALVPFLLLLALFIFNRTRGDNELSTKKYLNEKQGFSLEIPKEAKVDERVLDAGDRESFDCTEISYEGVSVLIGEGFCGDPTGVGIGAIKVYGTFIVEGKTYEGRGWAYADEDGFRQLVTYPFFPDGVNYIGIHIDLPPNTATSSPLFAEYEALGRKIAESYKSI